MSKPRQVWRVRKFDSRESMDRWVKAHEPYIQFEEVFINDKYAVEWRWLNPIEFVGGNIVEG